MGHCPFCKSLHVSIWTETDGNFAVTDAWVECDDCGARGPSADTEAESAQKWNAATAA
ncbi:MULTISPECIES: Lar family restriction alleviation protein [unclassified Bradyrhizobium]